MSDLNNVACEEADIVGRSVLTLNAERLIKTSRNEPFKNLNPQQKYARKTNKCNDYSFSLLIMCGTSYMFRHFIAIRRAGGRGTLPEDGNVMPKHVGATIHN
jgi:hypothetical protein